MIPWSLIDTAQVPGGGQLRLKRRGAEFSIMLGDNELMNSRLSGSEEALARLACDALGARPAPRILIGGLGMGFTLRAALEACDAGAQIIVAELVPAVVAWACGPMADLHGASLDDPRVQIETVDVRLLINAARASYDAIILDVDNGPEGLTSAANDGLYTRAGLRAAHAALRPAGVLAVWSTAPDQGFTTRLRGAGFVADAVRVRAHGGRSGARHVVWIARRAPGGTAIP